MASSSWEAPSKALRTSSSSSRLRPKKRSAHASIAFAAVQAATRTGVDVGLRFIDAPDSELLRPADAPGQATHRLSLTGVNQVDDEVRRLLLAAYEQNG
jgi:hypothetical protein